MAIPEKYRAAFVQYGVTVPPALLAALAYRLGEPKVNAQGGIMRISSGARRDFNRAMGKAYTGASLADASKSIEVAAWLLDRIAWAYKDGAISNIPQEWHNVPNFTRLVILGYLAGFSASSKRKGVAYYYQRMAAGPGYRPPGERTPENIIEFAAQDGQGNRAIGRPSTMEQVNKVYQLYQDTRPAMQEARPLVAPPVANARQFERAPLPTPPVTPAPVPQPDTGAGMPLPLLLGGLGLLVWSVKKWKK